MNRTFEDGRWVVELKPSGIGRWIAAGLLSFWLAGWVMGEVAGIGLLLGSAGILANHSVSWLPRMPASAALPGVLFALLWVGFWTLGGLLAAAQVLRLVWGMDRIEYDSAGVKVLRAIGPLGRSRTFPRDEIRGVGLRRNQVVIETRRGVVNLTRLGSRAEHVELKADIERALGATPVAEAELPSGWESDVDPRGLTVLRRARGLRGKQVVLVGVLFAAFAVATGATVMAAATGSDPLTWIPATLLFLFTAATATGTAWLAFGREEILLGGCRAEVRRSFGSRQWTRSFESASLELEHGVDSDGDDFYRLVLRGAGGSKTLAQVFHEPAELLRLGRWMAAKLECEVRLPSHLKVTSDAA